MHLATVLTCLLVFVYAAAANNDEKLVMTPGGLLPKVNVHEVPHGGRVQHTDTEIRLVAANGTILHSAPVTKRQTSVNIPPLNDSLATNTGHGQKRDLQQGYVAYTLWPNPNGANLGAFYTSWAVPAAPRQQDGQLIYLFNGLVPTSDGSAILQPVLQFGVSPAGGGNYWAVASWYVVGTQGYHSALQIVPSGQVLTGVMTLDGTTTSGATRTYSYTSSFVGINTSTFSITTTQLLDYFFEALEIYTATSPLDMPIGNTLMYDIAIENKDGTYPTAINWRGVADTDDGFNVALVSPSARNGSVRIIYPIS